MYRRGPFMYLGVKVNKLVDAEENICERKGKPVKLVKI